MINTAAFESAERAKRIFEVARYVDMTLTYAWLKPYLEQAYQREKAFAKANEEIWKEQFELGKVDK